MMQGQQTNVPQPRASAFGSRLAYPLSGLASASSFSSMPSRAIEGFRRGTQEKVPLGSKRYLPV